ncbi:MAG: hypothetical protein C4574_04690 [Candidatus Latescibacterota bacterium]|nr:MAG: hypothetical protein C4574_04690 [Candidatus Latescibacterota bacterium]
MKNMLDDVPNRDLIVRAEDLILRLREVRSARIYTDEEGRITEIHVVAETERAPKLIARDVETCLKAALGISVDYRKIGVVVMEPRKETSGGEGAVRDPAPPEPAAPPADETAEEPVDLRELLAEAGEAPSLEPARAGSAEEGSALEFLEEDARVRFRSIGVTIEGERVEVEVKLEKSGLVVTGVGSDVRRCGSHAAAAAAAALAAVGELVDESVHLCLDGVAEAAIAGRPAVCVVVSVVRGREAARFAGCALAGDDRSESAALAVLDALNRPLGRWKLRREIHYRIT